MSGVGVALAIVIGLLSSFIQSLGLTIQRKSHIQNDALPLELQRTPTRRPLWLFGFGIYITSNIFATIFQLDTLPIVILAPLGAVSLIYNALLARLILGDRFGKRTIAGTALVAVGATLIAVFGVVQEEEHGIQELLRLWARPAFLGFFGSVVGLTGVVLVIAHVVSYVTYRSMRQGRIRLPDDMEDEALDPAGAPSNYASPCHPAAIPFQPTSKHSAPSSVAGALADTEVESTETTGLLAPATIVKTPSDHPSTPTRSRVRFASISSNRTDEEDPLDSVLVIQPTPAQQRTITLTGLAFAACSGVISGMSLVLAKAAVELLVMTLEYYRTGKGANQFAHPQSWFLVAGLAVGGMAQLVYLNYSLCFASPALICPLAFCFFNISSIFDGLVFYDQFSLLSPTQIGLVSTGVAVLLLGVVVVSAVQPTGEGGVEVGTWVEDESALDEEDEVDGKLPDQPFPRSTSPDLLTADHDDNESDRISEDTIRASAYPHSRASERHTQATRPGSDATRPVIEGADSIIDDPSSPRTRKPLIQRRSTMPHEPGTFTIPMPQSHSIHGSTSLSGSAVFSPNSPMSPNTAKRRRRRYGSLLPLPLPLPMPYQRHNDMPAAAGFAIGLGAASPGFMLRSEHEMSPVTGHAGSAAERGMGRGRRVRSRSEGQEAMSRLMRTGDELDGRGSDTGGRGPRRRSEEGSRGMIRQEVLSGDALNDPAEHPSTEGDAAEQTRRSSARSEGRSWWSSIFARRDEGRIKLDEERSPTSR